MRATIKAMSIKRQEIDQKIQTCRSELKNVCPVVLVNSIRLKIHDLNSKLFKKKKKKKEKKEKKESLLRRRANARNVS